MKNSQKDPSFCNVYVDKINKSKKDSFYMIECAKEISLRLYSIKFTLNIIIDLSFVVLKAGYMHHLLIQYLFCVHNSTYYRLKYLKIGTRLIQYFSQFLFHMSSLTWKCGSVVKFPDRFGYLL